MMPQIPKPYTTVEEQIELLRERGMQVDDALARQWLRSVGYYRLSGYWYTRRIMSDPVQEEGNPPRPIRTDNFLPDTRFSDIAALYEFDRKLLTQVYDGIERVEISLRTAIAETLGGIDVLAFYDRENFRVRARSEFAHFQLVSSVMGRVNRALTAKDSVHIKHNVEKYGVQLAPWVLTDVFDFSDLSKLYKIMKPEQQAQVASYIGLGTRTLTLGNPELRRLRENHPLSGALQQLTIFRNKCAHHARIWNCTLSPVGTGVLSRLDGLETLSIAGLSRPEKQHQSEKIYGALLIIAKILQTVSPGSSWAHKTTALVKDALDQIPFLTEQEMGFPPGWDRESIWAD